MKIELLEDLYSQEIAALHDAEKQSLHAAPRLIQAIASDEARRVFTKHLETSKHHVRRLETLLRRREGPILKAAGMAGLLQELDQLITQPFEDLGLREAALIMQARKIEAHEIACYTGAIEVARLLGFDDDASVLNETLREEEKMEDLLSALSVLLTTELDDAEARIPERPKTTK